MMGYEVSTSIFNTTTTLTLFSLNDNLSPFCSSSASIFLPSSNSYPSFHHQRRKLLTLNFKPHFLLCASLSSPQARSASTVQVEEQEEVEIAKGYTMTQICDKMIDLFLNEKTKSKEWRKYLVFREEWNKYRDNFYARCQTRANMENDPTMKEKLFSLGRKMKKIDDEMEGHSELLKEIQDNPTDINAIVARRRKDFTGEFFRYLSLISDTYNSLEDRDGNYV